MHDSNGVRPIEAKPGLRKRRLWVKPLLFLLFVAGLVLTCPAPSKNFEWTLTPDIIDQGAGWLFTLWLKLLAWWHPDRIASDVDNLVFVGGVLSLFSVLMLLPRVPLVVTVGGQITLLALWMIFGGDCLDHHGVEAWNVCLGAMFIAALGFWQGTRWDYFVAAAFGATLGFFPLMRWPAIQTPLACVFILGVLGLGVAANAFLRQRAKVQMQDGQAGKSVNQDLQPSTFNLRPSLRLDWSFLRFLKPLAVFFVCFFVMEVGAFRVWSIMNNNAKMRHHPPGYSLIQSLGFDRNAYNLSYCDDCALTQGLLYEGRPWLDYDAEADKRLMALWRQRVLEDPGLVVRGAFAKALYLIRYFTGTLNSQATQYDDYPIKPSWITLVIGVAFCVGAVGCATMSYRRRNDRMLVLLAGTVGLGIASFAQLVIVVPFYLGCATAYCLGIFLILMPAARHIAIEPCTCSAGPQHQRNTLVCKLVGVLALVLMLVVGTYTAYRFFINRAEARELLADDPFQKLNQLRFDFAFRFNRLSIAEQQNVISRLLSARAPQTVFRLSPEVAGKPENVFKPVLAVGGNRFLCVVARLSQERKVPFPSRAQGPKSSVLLVVKNQDRLGDTLGFLESPEKYLKIADANWDGRYRMFVLPAPPDYATDAQFLGVSAFNFKSGSEGEGVGLDLIGAERLYRSDQTPR